MKFMECAVRDVIYGTNVRIVKPVNICERELRDNVFVSSFAEMQKGHVAGSGGQIQSHTLICGNVTLEENCFIGHNVMLINDLFRSGAPDPSPDNWISATLGDSVIVGSEAIILSPHVCSGAVIGAGSVMVKLVESKGIYAGNPARLLGIS